MRRGSPPHFRWWPGLVLLLWAGPALAQKTDSVWLRNGDRITGEVKSLARALLQYSTDDLGTIYIEWDNVDRISSTRTFEIQLRTGQRLLGTLRLATSGRVIVVPDTLFIADIVAIAPIRRSFLARLDGYLDLGLSYQKANRTLQLTSGFKVIYRAPRRESTLETSTFRENREDASETSRFSSNFTQRYLFGDRWSAGFGAGFERNDELDLSGRTTFLGFTIRTLSKTNHLTFWTPVGLVVTREQYFSTDSTSYGLEGLLSAAFNAFRYDRPKLDASITSQVYPSFTVSGRVRWQNDLRVSYELVRDFMVTLTLFDSFDSKPQSVGAARNDFGTTLAVSWTF